ncbi:hypothetical protein B0G52_12524 [Cohnella sp. SGD-V74]|uniref:hypothetical protein n=1 Tax=unclassified Cohnella TaxID=2636738 RepID=UPI000D4B48B8|nr:MULTISPECIES: hypothetical protein [unclassified Cohnella]PRX61505.1 hypothetical protein B0G52_12524 [Cohnella sp. SGD-V74]
MERVMLVSQTQSNQEEEVVRRLQTGRFSLVSRSAREDGIERLSVFRFGRLLLVYAEYREKRGKDRGFWNEEIERLLEPWPGGESGDRFEVRLNDIFHDDEPSEDVPWRRPGYEPRQRVGSLARLKPEQYASYVFLHYQLQEEKPRGFSKYYIIGSFERFIFSYQELPAQVEPPRKGLLATANTPQDWHGAMEPHFEPWADTAEEERIWRELEEIVSVEVNGQ